MEIQNCIPFIILHQYSHVKPQIKKINNISMLHCDFYTIKVVSLRPYLITRILSEVLHVQNVPYAVQA